jgi:SAM-dependent methyltransferase
MIQEKDKEYLLSFHVFPDPQEAQQYLHDSWGRMGTVLTWLKDLQVHGVKRVLELGANPYYLTLLMKRYLPLDLTLANFFGDSSQNGSGVQSIENSVEKHEFAYSHFNVELDSFPYRDSSFDCVIFCEILEHLILNADFAASEISRVLRPGGFVILTTPNAARLANLIQILKGNNIYSGYSKHGIYGRHNREYTLKEVVDLLSRHHFRMMDTVVKNIYPHPLRSRMIQSLRPKTWREHLFVLAQKQSEKQ